MISIIIPYYNRPEKLQRCLDSVLGQTYQDFEILVVDDCSDVPLTLDMDSRIKIFRNYKNLGPGLSRNVGLDNAKGEYIAFLDSDDYWDPSFLTKCLQRFSENAGLSMVYANGFVVNAMAKVIGIYRDSQIVTDSILPEILQESRQWGTGGCLWNTEYLKNIKWQSFLSWEDYAFDVDVALHCNKISGIKDCLVYYDSAGTDKLSKRNWKQTISGKGESLLHISKGLWNSDFRDSCNIKKAITDQLINYIIAIEKSKVTDETFIKPIIKELNKWNGFLFGLYINLLYYFPSNIKFRALRRLKKKDQRTLD